MADRALFDFEHLTLARDNTIRAFEGEHIQAGQITPDLQQKGVPIAPAVQTFDPNTKNNTPKTVKIPTINPLI